MEVEHQHSLLFSSDALDGLDTFEKKYLNDFMWIKELFASKNDAEASASLDLTISTSPENRERAIVAFVYGMLTDISDCERYFTYLSAISRDGFKLANDLILKISAYRFFNKIKIPVLNQLLWVMDRLTPLMPKNVEVEQVYINMFRQFNEFNPIFVEMTPKYFDILDRNKKCFEEKPMALKIFAYGFLRMALKFPKESKIRNRMINFSVFIIRQKFVDVKDLGRDLIRALQEVVKAPSAENLLRDLIKSPSSIHVSCKGIKSFLHTTTPRAVLQSCLSFDEEVRLMFMLENLDRTNYITHLSWFRDRFLSLPESEVHISDLIRYIICCFHPSNVVLASAIVPRFWIIGGLLRLLTSDIHAANCKLALYYDWLFYNPKRDSIMLIEPGILILEKSAKKYPFITNILGEFICMLALEYGNSSLGIDVGENVKEGLQDTVRKGVIPSLDTIFSHPEIDEEVKKSLMQLYGTAEAALPPPPLPETLKQEQTVIVTTETITTEEVLLESSDNPDYRMEVVSDNLVPIETPAEPMEVNNIATNNQFWIFGNKLQHIASFFAEVGNTNFSLIIPDFCEVLDIFSRTGVEVDIMSSALVKFVHACSEIDLPAQYFDDPGDYDLIDALFSTVYSRNEPFKAGKLPQLTMDFMTKIKCLRSRLLLFVTKKYNNDESDSKVMDAYLEALASFSTMNGYSSIPEECLKDLKWINERHHAKLVFTGICLMVKMPDFNCSLEFLRLFLPCLSAKEVYIVIALIEQEKLSMFSVVTEELLDAILKFSETEQQYFWTIVAIENTRNPRIMESLISLFSKSFKITETTQFLNGFRLVCNMTSLSLQLLLELPWEFVHEGVIKSSLKYFAKEALLVLVLTQWIRNWPTVMRESLEKVSLELLNDAAAASLKSSKLNRLRGLYICLALIPETLLENCLFCEDKFTATVGNTLKTLKQKGLWSSIFTKLQREENEAYSMHLKKKTVESPIAEARTQRNIEKQKFKDKAKKRRLVTSDSD